MEKLDSALSMNCTVYSLFQYFNIHVFYKPNNITTKLSFKDKSYFQSFAKQRDIDFSLWTQMGYI